VRIILLQKQHIETAGKNTENLEMYSLETSLTRHKKNKPAHH